MEVRVCGQAARNVTGTNNSTVVDVEEPLRDAPLRIYFYFQEHMNTRRMEKHDGGMLKITLHSLHVWAAR